LTHSNNSSDCCCWATIYCA